MPPIPGLDNRGQVPNVERSPAARGAHDLIGEEQRRFHRAVDTHGFDEWITPMFEDTRVFSRSLGETSGVVTRERCSFEDRGGESITLRPEGTAGVCRAGVSNGLTQSLPRKVFHAGPMFRYERPRKGRCRVKPGKASAPQDRPPGNPYGRE